jgi:hypothetical protein
MLELLTLRFLDVAKFTKCFMTLMSQSSWAKSAPSMEKVGTKN